MTELVGRPVPRTLSPSQLQHPGLVWEYGPELIAPAAAAFSRDRSYRYALTRTWDPGWPPLVWVMLNPSTADAFTDDPTISRVTGFSRRAGAGGIIVVNLFAYRAVKPSQLRQAADPVGPLNDLVLSWYCQPRVTAAVAWGAHGQMAGRGPAVTAMLAAREVRLLCLGTVQNGQPRHPLYVPQATEMAAFRPGSASKP